MGRPKKDVVPHKCLIFLCQSDITGPNKFCSKDCLRLYRQGARLKPKYEILTIRSGKTVCNANIMEQRPRLRLKPPTTFMKDSVVHIQESHNRHGKLLTLEVLNGIKVGLATSETIQQVIANIAQKHKYKRPESYVKHIEEMLTLYDTQD